MHRSPAGEGGCRGDTGRRLWLGCGCGSIAFTSHAYCAVSDPQLRFLNIDDARVVIPFRQAFASP